MVFIGDMTFQISLFYETHKYARTLITSIFYSRGQRSINKYTNIRYMEWNSREIPNDVIYYKYKSKYHYGTGKWVVF